MSGWRCGAGRRGNTVSKSKPAWLQGVFAAVTTPFDRNGRLVPEKLAENLRQYNATPLSGYLVTGSTGEAVLLTARETERVWATAREAAAPDRPVIVGIAAESARSCAVRARRASGLGAAAVLVRTPCFYREQMQADALARFYMAVADVSPVPVLVYSIPQNTGIAVQASLLRVLMEHPNIVGIKDSSGDVGALQQMVLEVPQAAVLVGTASVLRLGLLAGACGAILALASLVPGLCVALYEAVRRGDDARARQLQQALLPASNVLVTRYGVGGLKYALDQCQYYGGPPRLPLRGPDTAAQARIRAALERLLALAASVA